MYIKPYVHTGDILQPQLLQDQIFRSIKQVQPRWFRGFLEKLELFLRKGIRLDVKQGISCMDGKH